MAGFPPGEERRGKIDMQPVNIPVVIIIGVLTALAIYFKSSPGGPLIKESHNANDYYRESETEIELDLELLRDEKKARSGHAEVPLISRRAAYRDDAFSEISRLRTESKYYRNVNNFLQGILIVGSLVTTGIAGVSILAPEARWATMGASFLVGISSGFLGYFKYRERGFYLQQTADAIEEEWEALELGIGRYKRATSEAESLADFVEEIYRLKNEQRKREQHLDQPAEQKSVNDFGSQ
jgi:hypothetical protein